MAEGTNKSFTAVAVEGINVLENLLVMVKFHRSSVSHIILVGQKYFNKDIITLPQLNHMNYK